MSTTPSALVPETTPTVVPVISTATSEPTAREAVYKQYYDTQPVEPVVPAEPAVEPPVSAVVETAEPVKSAEPTREELMLQALTAVMEKVTAMEQRMSAPVQPAVPAVPTEPKKSPIDYLKAGDVEGFEAALIERVRASLEPVQQTLARETTDNAVARVRAEGEIKSFVNDINTKNPDLAPMQGWIVAEAKQLIDAQQDKIKSLDDYVTVYKDSVTKAVDTVRKAALTIRGSGKAEAMTTKREVIASAVVSPSAPERPASGDKEPVKEPESNVDYITRRQATHGVSRGL